MLVYVLNKDKKPLMPCTAVKARILLKQGKAKVIQKEPFTIQLLYGSSGYKQDITLGVDAGAKHIGLSATTEKKELYSADVELRTDIVNLLSTRRELRRSRRNRKTRYRKPRFNNRKIPDGWLAPSIQNRINAHLSVIGKVHQILPITAVIVETASFDIQKIRNPEIQGAEYQQGEQLGFENVREYVLFRDGHVCQHCHGKSKDKILNVHHLESRKTGGNAPNNLITLCETCHKAYHAGEIDLKLKRGKSFKDAAFMGIMRWTLYERLKAKYPNVRNTYGYITKHNRIHRMKLPKNHHIDAFCIAGNFKAERLGYYYYQKQIRKHCRQLHDMNFDKGGIKKPFRLHKLPEELFGFRTYDKVILDGQKYFIYTRARKGQFTLKKSFRREVVEKPKSVTCKKLELFTKRKSYITELVYQ